MQLKGVSPHDEAIQANEKERNEDIHRLLHIVARWKKEVRKANKRVRVLQVAKGFRDIKNCAVGSRARDRETWKEDKAQIVRDPCVY